MLETRADDSGSDHLDANSVILVGERAAVCPARSAPCRDSPSAPAPGWPGCRAGPATAARSRPAACPTCCPAAARWPTPPPGSTPRRPGAIELAAGLEGRDADEILIAAADGELAALVVAGVDPNDFGDPQAALEGLEAVNFVISLEPRASGSPSAPTWSSRSR